MAFMDLLSNSPQHLAWSGFVEDSFPYEPGRGGLVGDGFGMIQTRYLLFALFQYSPSAPPQMMVVDPGSLGTPYPSAVCVARGAHVSTLLF